MTTTVEPKTLLLVEDDQKLGAEIETTLTERGFSVVWLTDGDDAYRADPSEFDLIVLDLMLPNRHGFDVLKRYRETSDVPVIILTARTETEDKIRGFKYGGDDYLTKPFWPEELLARVDARLRRPTIQRENKLSVGELTIETEARTVTVSGEIVELTKVEFDILHALAKRPKNAISRQQLLDQAMDEEREGTERTLDVHVSRIRKKLGEHSGILKTVWGIGYKLDDG